MVSGKVEELVKGEVKRTFNPEFLNRLDEIILFLALSRDRPDPDSGTHGQSAQCKFGAEGDHGHGCRRGQRSGSSTKRSPTPHLWSASRCAGRCKKYIEDPLSEAMIQGTITTRPAFIEVFLEDNKLFYRPVDAEKTEGVVLDENC